MQGNDNRATPPLGRDLVGAGSASPCRRGAWRSVRPAVCLLQPAAPQIHTPQHLGECLDLWRRDAALAQHPGEVAVALWFHDAVYEHGRADNETASADWAAQVLRDAGADGESARRVHAMVMATRHDQLPVTPDEQLLVDIDLSILGAAPVRFGRVRAADPRGIRPRARAAVHAKTRRGAAVFHGQAADLRHRCVSPALREPGAHQSGTGPRRRRRLKGAAGSRWRAAVPRAPAAGSNPRWAVANCRRS